MPTPKKRPTAKKKAGARTTKRKPASDLDAGAKVG